MGKVETGHEAPQELLTVRDFLRWAVSAFNAGGVAYGHGTDNAWDEARWLVLGALHLPFDSPDWVLDARLGAAERSHLAALLARRVRERVPTAYLLGEGQEVAPDGFARDAEAALNLGDRDRGVGFYQ